MKMIKNLHGGYCITAMLTNTYALSRRHVWLTVRMLLLTENMPALIILSRTRQKNMYQEYISKKVKCNYGYKRISTSVLGD